MDYLKYFDSERYLFEDVHQRFQANHFLDAFDFFSIIIWKANRAKSKVAKRMLKENLPGERSLEARCHALTEALYEAPTSKERLRLLIKEWGFALPMASAILTVCWPGEFTIYDYRVRDLLGELPQLNNGGDFEKTWKLFEKYKAGVIKLAPQKSLRDKDRYLSGKSKAQQLENDIRKSFVKSDE
jgi:hypothetical protein